MGEDHSTDGRGEEKAIVWSGAGAFFLVEGFCMQARSGMKRTEAQVSPPTVRKGRLAQMGGAEHTNSPSCRSLQLPTCGWIHGDGP